MSMLGFIRPDIYKISAFMILLFIYFLLSYFVMRDPSVRSAFFFPNSWILHMAVIYILSCALIAARAEKEYV